LILDEFGVRHVRLKLSKPGRRARSRPRWACSSSAAARDARASASQPRQQRRTGTHLRAAIDALRARFGNVVVSPVYRVPAVGFDGPDFLNAAAIIADDLDPFALTEWLQRSNATTAACAAP
jgi:hypothetical protein